MTLEEKFTELESQMTTQQTAVINALNAIIEALGGAPPTGTITLVDIQSELALLNTNMANMITLNSGFYAELLDAVGLINVNTDTIITNNSLNAQRTIQAIYATFCECTTDTPLLPPVIDVTPTIIVDDAKCRRIQFYLALFGTWLTSIANYGATGAAVTGGVLQTLLSAAGVAVGLTATGAEVGAAGGIPGAVAGAVIGAIVGAIYAFGGNLLKDAALLYNSPVVQAQLLAEMYAAPNADDGQSAFQYIISQNFDTIPAGIINFLWWSAWSNDIYSGSPVVDDSAFDGSICGEPGFLTDCWHATIADFANVAITNLANSATATYTNTVIWPVGWPTSDNYAGTIGTGTLDVHADNGELFVLNADVYDYYVILGTGTLYSDDEVVLFNTPGIHQITTHTAYIFVIGGDTDFQLCTEDPTP